MAWLWVPPIRSKIELKSTKMMPFWDVVLDVNTFSMSKFKSKGAELFCPLSYAHFNDYDG